MVTTLKKEKEIHYFAKGKTKELKNLLDSKEVQQEYSGINSDCLDFEKYKVNINNFTMRYNETNADLITIPIKHGSVKNLLEFKTIVEAISKENKLALYINDVDQDQQEADEYDDWFLRISSPSMNRNIQTMRLMAYRESEKINSLLYEVNHAKDKSLVANIGSIKQLLNLGVDTMLNLSYKNENVVGRIKRMDTEDIELLVQCQPELITISTIQLKDPWVINSIEGETPINWMWGNVKDSSSFFDKEQDEFLSSMPWEKAISS